MAVGWEVVQVPRLGKATYMGEWRGGQEAENFPQVSLVLKKNVSFHPYKTKRTITAKYTVGTLCIKQGTDAWVPDILSD